MAEQISNKIILTVILAFMLLIPIVLAGDVLWEFDNFENKYKVYGSYTCDISKDKPCVNELGWQGKSIKFKFPLDEDMTDVLKFNFYVDYRASTKPVDIYSGKYKIVEDLIVDDRGWYSVEIPKNPLLKKSEIKIRIKDVKVGYGKPAQGFVLGKISLENYRDYVLPVLECQDEISSSSLLSWDNNDFDESKFYVYVGYDEDFSKGTYKKLKARENPQSLEKYWKKILKLDEKSLGENLYFRIYAKNKIKGNAFSNVCEVQVS